MTINEYLQQWEGYTTQEICNIFQWKGINGLRYSFLSCPLARDIRNETGEICKVSGWHIYSAAKIYPLLFCGCNDLRGLWKFVRNFDKGSYPALDMEK